MSSAVQQSPADGSPGGYEPEPPSPHKPAYAKRGKITIVACVSCKRRKAKCDGQRPTCTQCRTREEPCVYNMSENERRLTFLRESVSHLEEEKKSLESLMWNLKHSTEDEAFDMLRRVRAGPDAQSSSAVMDLEGIFNEETSSSYHANQ